MMLIVANDVQYPAVDNMKLKEGNLRISAHTDESLITLLLTAPGARGPLLHAVSHLHPVSQICAAAW
jgi:hypothetical protein